VAKMTLVLLALHEYAIHHVEREPNRAMSAPR
jgi:hypothetical protein